MQGWYAIMAQTINKRSSLRIQRNFYGSSRALDCLPAVVDHFKRWSNPIQFRTVENALLDRIPVLGLHMAPPFQSSLASCSPVVVAVETGSQVQGKVSKA